MLQGRVVDLTPDDLLVFVDSERDSLRAITAHYRHQTPEFFFGHGLVRDKNSDVGLCFIERPLRCPRVYMLQGYRIPIYGECPFNAVVGAGGLAGCPSRRIAIPFGVGLV